ncbi:unnamed protein product [Rotaria socialis]|uniref:HAT C-terminal dimerisation domain-containing protein n=3 Tax=Rotaria socialis TaxID=392032 RepID=A0A820SAC1_9BILA|nr:unnamed protein product [Rotaria socialis]CAF3241301.1 unnamed protein product [Rotaria socialis]CAF4449725.1 unnamed protein product [Rotaria socialis]CAF4464516.1 unnamed protein product [Rotaria socialis]
MKCLLDDVTHLSITVDIWTDRRAKSFLGLTGHFIDSNYIPQAFLLDFCRLKGSHTGDNVRNMTEKILEGLQITHKVYRIITDNAASMIKAYKFGLIVSNSHDILINHDNDEEEHYESVESSDDASDFLRRWTLTDWHENEHDSNDVDGNIASRLSCFAHSLQLTVRDGVANVPCLSKCLLKCIKLAEWSHKSTKIADLLDDIGKSISQRTVTRWSSEYLLMKSILSLEKANVDDITEILEDNEVKFNNNDFIVLQEAVELLEPFAEITVRVQSQSVVTASLVVPSVVHLLDHVNVMKTNLRILKSMCIQLEQSIHRRFAGIVKRLHQQSVNANDRFSDHIYFVCTFLDPEFKLYWLRQMKYSPACESKMKESLIQMVLDECDYGQNRSSNNLRETLSSFSSRSIDMNDSVVQSTRTTTDKKRKLFQYDDDSNGCNVSPNSLKSPMNEINAYLNDPLRCNFSLYWKNSQLHTLKNVVKRVYSIQATSAPIERVFSRAGIIMSPRRTSMREEVFRNLVFLRMNESLI